MGLVLNALQTPLYRILEGYLLWPAWLYTRACHRQRTVRQRTADRLATPGTPLLKRALLQERLSRYPVDDAQMTPTRLGNAIRRFEEYGHDRYRLDTQILWNELSGVVPEQARRQVDTARTNVDFFVALLYGHGAVLLCATGSLASHHAHRTVLAFTIAVLGAFIPLWYRAAVAATDEWAATIRAVVNLGRKPLAEALGLVLPQDLADERTMWQLVTRMSRRSYAPAAEAALAPFRAGPPTTPPP